VPDDRKWEQARSATKWGRETISCPDDKIILAARHGLSNIFLHFPQGIEKKEEIGFAARPVMELRGY
jgi:hypothetical protein